jgi:hypothetical protein
MDEEVKDESVMTLDGRVNCEMNTNLLKDSLSAHFLHFDSNTTSESSSRGSVDI